MLNCAMGRGNSRVLVSPADRERMQEVIRFTARTLTTSTPVPFGALIVKSTTGERLVRAVNAVARQNDPSCHAELRAVRLACRKIKSTSLRGFTLYSTCEPCPMCMANAMWAGLDRVVYGATMADASRHCRQIHISAKAVSRRSDMACIVEGPVLRKESYALFTHPNMLRAFSSWMTANSSEAVAFTRSCLRASSVFSAAW